MYAIKIVMFFVYSFLYPIKILVTKNNMRCSDEVDFDCCGLHFDRVKPEDLNKVGCKINEKLSLNGYMHLVNTGFDFSTSDRVQSTTTEFFHCSAENKLKYKRSGKNDFGYVGLDEADILNPTRPVDIRESFNVPLSCFQKDSDNEWPVGLNLNFSDAFEDFAVMATKLSMRILLALSQGMNLHKDDFLTSYHRHVGTEGNSSVIKSLYYPAVKGDCRDDQVRCGEHTDLGSLTLLFLDGASGLQIKGNDGQFCHVQHRKQSVFVMAGDCLQMQTEGRIRSATHRVVLPDDPVKRKSPRFSLAFFLQHDDHIVVNKPLRYGNNDTIIPEPCDPITSKNWLESKSKRIRNQPQADYLKCT